MASAGVYCMGSSRTERMDWDDAPDGMTSNEARCRAQSVSCVCAGVDARMRRVKEWNRTEVRLKLATQGQTPKAQDQPQGRITESQWYDGIARQLPHPTGALRRPTQGMSFE